MAGEGETHYYWRDDVRAVVGACLSRFKCAPNTYFDHPTGYGADERSADFWGRDGRGSPIIATEGHDLVAFLFSDEHPLMIDWLIWQGNIWAPSWGWAAYWDWYDQHYDHVHVTFR